MGNWNDLLHFVKPAAQKAGIEGLTNQRWRSTFATRVQ
jgi:hypothetical protein